jgi:hypothetical protein
LEHKKLVSPKVSSHAVFQALNIDEKYCATLKNNRFSSVNYCYFVSLTFRLHTMKKLLIGVLILPVLAVSFIYYKVPATLKVSEVVRTRCTPEGAFRSLAIADKRRRWWPGDDSLRVMQTLRDQMDAVYRNKEILLFGRFWVLPMPEDSSIIEWQVVVNTPRNPIGKIIDYVATQKAKKRMHDILIAMQAFVEKPENIYGMDIKETSITDTLLISTKANFRRYPSTTDIYKLVTNLQNYATHQNANVTGRPLLNIEQQADSGYNVRLALPVDKVLQDNKDISFTRMIPGKFLVAEVTGGPGAVTTARQQMNQYFEDYRRTSMAIPFQVLVTDRINEPDTSKWKTRIYAPVY